MNKFLWKSKYSIERISLKIIKLSCHLSFNETCLNNNLLPTYTNIYIHEFALDTSARSYQT